jgi:hypothetical protein
MRQVYVVKTRVHNYFTMYMLYSKEGTAHRVNVQLSTSNTKKLGETTSSRVDAGIMTIVMSHDNCHEHDK